MPPDSMLALYIGRCAILITFLGSTCACGLLQVQTTGVIVGASPLRENNTVDEAQRFQQLRGEVFVYTRG
jgi:hypothetical protein